MHIKCSCSHPECGMGIRQDTHLECGMDLHCLSDGIDVGLLSLWVPALLPVDHSLVLLLQGEGGGERGGGIRERGWGFHDKPEEWVIGSVREERPELMQALEPPVVEHPKVAVNFKITGTKVIWNKELYYGGKSTMMTTNKDTIIIVIIIMHVQWTCTYTQSQEQHSYQDSTKEGANV